MGINQLNEKLIYFNEIDPVKSFYECKAFCDTIEGCKNWTLTSTPFSANFLQCYALSSCSNSVVASGPRKCDGEEEFADYHFNGDAFTSDCYTESLDCRSSINKLNKTLLQF